MEKTKATPTKRNKKPSVSAEDLSERPIFGVQILLNVHFWMEEGAEVPPLALAMVGDLLSCSPCEVRDQSTSSITASFPDAAQAVAAVRRLRRLYQGFSQGFKAGHLGGCFILSNLGEGPVGVEAQLAERLPLMTRGNRGEVFLVGDLCESARSIPGLRFEAVSGERMPIAADGPHRAVLKLMPPVQMEGYAEEPMEDWTPVVKNRAQAVEPDVPAPPLIVAEVPAIDEAGMPQPPLPGDGDGSAGQGIAGFSRVDEAPRRNFPLRWAAIGLAAVVVCVAAAIFVHGSRRSQNPVQPATPVAPAPSSTVNTVSPSPTVVSAPTSPPVEAPKTAATAPKLSAKEIAAAKRKGAKVGSDSAADEGDAGAPQEAKNGGDKTSIPLSPDEINRSLAIADKQSGDGDFDDAKRTYRIILKHDPSNARAKDGLARAIRNSGHD